MIGSDINQSRILRSRYIDRVSRYDVALVAIPMLFVGMVIIGWILGLPTPLKVVLGGILAGIIVTDVLFINPPTALGSPSDRRVIDRHESEAGS